MKTILFLIGIFVTLSAPASANSVYYFNNSGYYNQRVERVFTKLTVPQKEKKSEVLVKIKVQPDNAFVGEYNNNFYTNPTMTPYYYPDNNQKSHLPSNPYNYIY